MEEDEEEEEEEQLAAFDEVWDSDDDNQRLHSHNNHLKYHPSLAQMRHVAFLAWKDGACQRFRAWSVERARSSCASHRPSLCDGSCSSSGIEDHGDGPRR